VVDSITCFRCGIVFGVPEHWLKSRREDKESFWCPNGHSQAFVKSIADQLRQERDSLRQQMSRVIDEREEQRKRAVRAEHREKRLQKRTAAGTCPCCKRTFSNMAIHMKKQHPGFVAEQANVVPLKDVLSKK
jgi:predicted nucleic acid binding AN1-type Zn finger protein